MSTDYYVALDTHCSFTELAAVSKSGRLIKRDRCSTTIPALLAALDEIGGERVRLTLEEGPLADWLNRNLKEHVKQLVVCEPRRNRLVAKDGDKDDPIDALKLAQLFRGGYLKEVHQAGSLERSLLKQHVGLYHDRVRERVRQGHQIVAQLRRHGVFASIANLHDAETRRSLWRRLPKLLARSLDLLWEEFELFLRHEETIRSDLLQLARKEEPVRRFVDVPGIGWIRAVTFYVYVDTPFRFEKKSSLWRYSGIGLMREHSGQGKAKTRRDIRGNRSLKDVLLGAAKSAIAQANTPFAEKYQYWTQEEGTPPSTARRNVARSIASTLWSMWKTGSRYEPARVRGVGHSAND